MKYYRPNERTNGLDLGIQEAVKNAWETQVKMIYDRGYEDGQQDSVVNSKEAYKQGLKEGLGKNYNQYKKDLEDYYNKGKADGYKNGHKEGLEYRKEITEGAMKEEYRRGYNDGQLDREKSSYQLGYKDALEAKEAIAITAKCDTLNEALDRGRDEAWELAKKIGLEDGFGYATLLYIFGTRNISEIFQTNTAQQAIEKVKAWEEKQKQDATDKNVGSRQFLQLTSRELKNNEGYIQPYYEIEWLENGEKHVGYGSFKLECVLDWLAEYFGIYATSGEVKDEP